jgi:hypothetical protein
LEPFKSEMTVFTGNDDAEDDQMDCLAYAAVEVEKGDDQRAGTKQVPYVHGWRG